MTKELRKSVKTAKNKDIIPLGALEKEDYKYFKYFIKDNIENYMSYTIEEVRQFITDKIDKIIITTSLTNIDILFNLRNNIKKQYIITSILETPVINKIRESWIETSLVFSLLNTKYCERKNQRKLFYISALELLKVKSISQDSIEKMRNNLISNFKTSLDMIISNIEDKFFTYLNENIEIKERYDIFSYEDINNFYNKILNYGKGDYVNDNQLLFRFDFMKNDDIKNTRNMMLAIFMYEITNSLLKDQEVMIFDLRSCGRHQWLSEKYNFKIDKNNNINEYSIMFLSEVKKIKDKYLTIKNDNRDFLSKIKIKKKIF